MKKVRIEDDLFARAKRCAEEAGYSSVEELVAHAVERAVLEIEEPEKGADLEQRLKGLGYIE